MSQEEAHPRPTAHTPGPVASSPAADADRLPRAPLFTARTDPTAGVLRTRGHLDAIGAEMLCRIVTALHRLGHAEVVVRLGSSTVDDDALVVLAGRVGPGGVRLLRD